MKPAAIIEIKGGIKAVIDGEDLARVLGKSWYAQWRYPNGAPSHITCVRCYDRGKVLYLHRFLMNAPEGVVVDHVNGDVLDNRKSNLRFASICQNMQNRKISRTNKCGYKGVYLGQRNCPRPWRAEIRANRKRFHLGSFATPEEAHEAYVIASRELHGEFGRVK